jgi:glycogen(starch) synthase
MRVLAVGNMYPPHHLGGYEVCWQGVTTQLLLDGHDARILTTDYRRADVNAPDPEGHEVRRELDFYWRDHEWRRLDVLARLRLERRNAATFDRHLREFQPGLIAWWCVGGMSLSLIERARQAGLPAVLFVHDYWPTYGVEHDLWTRMWAKRIRVGATVERLTGLPTRPDLGHAGRWLFNSAAVRDATLATGLDVMDYSILSPGVERSYLELDPPDGPGDWRWRLLYVGRVVEQKGVHTAIEALSMLPPEARLRIVGDGDERYRGELELLAERLDVSERIVFESSYPRDHLPAVYRSADALVFPVEWAEPWGLVPLEAMAMGTPVLATGTGGSGDYLVDGENSLLFAPGNPVLLADGIRRLATDECLRERLRVKGFETASHHSEDAFNRRAVADMEAIVAPGDLA